MKIILEEIVKRHQTNRYRREQLGTFDVPVEMLPVLQDGLVLVIDDETVDNNSRRKLVVANVRIAAILHARSVGLIIDLIDHELYKAIEEDQDAPADYSEFCKLEKIEP